MIKDSSRTKHKALITSVSRQSAKPVNLSKSTFQEPEPSRIDTTINILYSSYETLNLGSLCRDGLQACRNTRHHHNNEDGRLLILPWSRPLPYGTKSLTYPFMYFVLQLRYTPIRKRIQNICEATAATTSPELALFEESFFLLESLFLCTGLPALQAELIATGSCHFRAYVNSTNLTSQQTPVCAYHALPWDIQRVTDGSGARMLRNFLTQNSQRREGG